MAATAVTGSCNTTFLPSSLPKPPPPISRQFLHSYKITAPQHLTLISTSITRLSVSSPETSAVEAQQSDDGVSSSSASLTGCNACGREEIERGCNGEGRIQGGIATVPGFGWWPIKAYRPCPAYLQSGGRYRRTGQSMDEVVSGGGGHAKPASRSKKSYFFYSELNLQQSSFAESMPLYSPLLIKSFPNLWG
ncbi:uncharacterized protein LOC121766358 isoform X1 [Salvia splendens]|uniref:uncharacterized protein LOC121766358 isoform X1 n=1 Tax=Salvia splendens TaxID=180675 RepID=UPI001C25B7FF|nr:uncharacterized protein LOC121766358 isoform X1 [Salvia splendens]